MGFLQIIQEPRDYEVVVLTMKLGSQMPGLGRYGIEGFITSLGKGLHIHSPHTTDKDHILLNILVMTDLYNSILWFSFFLEFYHSVRTLLL